jgi:hypothetical protein
VPAGFVALQSFFLMSASPATARSVGSMSRWLQMSFTTTPAGILPGQRMTHGTRNAPSQFEFFSLRNGVILASGQLFMCGPLSVEYMTNVSLAMPSSSSRSSSEPTVLS